MGITHTDAVVVYGDADNSWGGEGWAVWVLAWLGHQGPVHAFDGGISLWQATGYPVVKSGHADFPEETYSIHLQPDLNISAEDIADGQGTPSPWWTPGSISRNIFPVISPVPFTSPGRNLSWGSPAVYFRGCIKTPVYG
ncbi:MAG: hypothetical protein R2874_06965 [Desulfobacterales bacterium]